MKNFRVDSLIEGQMALYESSPKHKPFVMNKKGKIVKAKIDHPPFGFNIPLEEISRNRLGSIVDALDTFEKAIDTKNRLRILVVKGDMIGLACI